MNTTTKKTTQISTKKLITSNLKEMKTTKIMTLLTAIFFMCAVNLSAQTKQVQAPKTSSPQNIVENKSAVYVLDSFYIDYLDDTYDENRCMDTETGSIWDDGEWISNQQISKSTDQQLNKQIRE